MCRMKPKRAGLYVRVSTEEQTVQNQELALAAVADRRSWQIVQTYRDEGISGAKSRDKRPGFDAALKDAVRRRFDVLMVWSIDRLGRSTATVVNAAKPSLTIAVHRATPFTSAVSSASR